ncbi:hypothetical protein PF005_g12040 [Phytophthora fragariae]|uniref:Uncharacterized protein n=1 Tax=Phytophthora fragariae TaxID=53985 RepID=A0A6A3Z107_9STRA|nr:hypothetical protein PF003_g39683 [Phytophthora fragariae]KAE8936858.1 hypothetical protein PF009_g13227 [Phytophthora fragariae]KAE9095195.1 hypothetical protein PF006_g24075 [Phytophthora fragariae]KAE9107058.1 hypothetical protein PF007_g13180 [Phytophthora fragariae]KAE9208853.1 hypothetical protein PF005_g12040 [Phytophthora fragariae]
MVTCTKSAPRCQRKVNVLWLLWRLQLHFSVILGGHPPGCFDAFVQYCDQRGRPLSPDV